MGDKNLLGRDYWGPRREEDIAARSEKRAQSAAAAAPLVIFCLFFHYEEIWLIFVCSLFVLASVLFQV
jgi:hypothetical protein